MARLRLGVIGSGSWAVAAHLPSFATRSREVEFVGVSRHGPEALRRIRDQFGFAVASEDYREVLAAGIDIAVVSSPTALHHEHAKAALEAGAHVLCEKPFTLTSEQAWDLVATAERRDRHLLVSFGWNYKPLVERAHALISAKGIGAIEQLSVTMSSQTRELLTETGAYPDASTDTTPEMRTWTDPNLSGGGYGQAQLSHAIALALWLTGERVTAAFALTGGPTQARVELHDAFSLRLQGGGIASVGGGSSFVGADRNKHHLNIEAIGSDGQFCLDVFRERASLFRPDDGQVDLKVSAGDGDYDGALAAQRLVDLALGRPATNPAPGELGARTVEALELAYRSAGSGALEARKVHA